MGPWRTLIGRARGRPRYLPTSSPSSPSSSSSSSCFSTLNLVKSEEHRPLDPTSRLDSHSCESLIEGIWPRLGLSLLQISAQKEPEQNAGSFLADAKEFLMDSSLIEGFGRLGFSEGPLQAFERRKLSTGSLPGELVTGTLTKPWLNAGAPLDDTNALLLDFLKQNAPKHGEALSLHFSVCDAAVRVPGLDGSEDLIIQADSVKRKRKKKMNKHKHRKLRRIARKSRK